MKDWSEEWNKRRSEAAWKAQRKTKASPDDYGELLNLLRYPGSILERIFKLFELQDKCTVLDVGAGTGAFAIPVAKKVSAVTIVEPSKEMVRYLMKSADRNGLNNIDVITKRWEDISRDDYEISYKSLLKQLVHLDMDSEKRVRDYLKKSNRLFKIKNNGELWVRCKYRDALIWYRKE